MKEIFIYKESEQYINILQENINRMAHNSANCKNWLVAIIAGALAVSFASDNAAFFPRIVLFLKCITVLFFFLDCLYLGLERDFIKMETAFIKSCKSLNSNEDDIKNLLLSFKSTLNMEENTPNECAIKIHKLWKQLKGALCAMWSWSTTPFYGIIFYVLCKISAF